MAFFVGACGYLLLCLFVAGLSDRVSVYQDYHTPEALDVGGVPFLLAGFRGDIFGGARRGFVFLFFFVGPDFLQRGTLFSGGLASFIVAVQVDQELAAGTDSLALAPGSTGAAWVEVSVADYFRELERVGVGAVALAVVAAVWVIGPTGVVVVIFHLAVGDAVVVVAGCPV